MCVCVREHMCVHVHACVHVCVRVCVGWCDLDCNQRSLRKRLERNNGGSKPSGLGNAEKGREGGRVKDSTGAQLLCPVGRVTHKAGQKEIRLSRGRARGATLRSGEGCQLPGTDRCEQPLPRTRPLGRSFSPGWGASGAPR